MKKLKFPLYKYVAKHKTHLTFGILFLFLSSVTLLVFPFVTGKLVDAATGESEWWINDIDTIAIGLGIILIFQSFFSYMRVYVFALITEKTLFDIRTDLFNNLVSLPLSFYDDSRTGELQSRINSDVTQIHDVLNTKIAEFMRQMATLLVSIGIILVTSTELTLVMLSCFPILIVVALIFGRFIKKLSKQTQESLANSNIIVEESLTSIQVVKAFANEFFEQMRYRKLQSEVKDMAMKTAKYRSLFISFIIMGLFGAIIFVLWYGSKLIQAGDISIGDLTSFLIYTMMIGGSAGGISEVYSQVQKAIGASERVFELLKETPEEVSFDKNKISLQGDIEFKNVLFHYPSRKDISVLRDVSFQVKKGQTIGLVGPSGAGKSTIISLLMHFYDIDGGTILIDSKNIQDIPNATLRKSIGFVSQDVILFGGSIRENIGYGKIDATEAEIIQAAKQANAWEFIEKFPEGLDTIVGDRGIKLSGGQKQRVSIARAILKNPSILILDEATSSLDAESEKLVQEALEELMVGRTSIVIAHRLATIRKVDKILVFNKGEIVESGKHEELASKENGLYAQLSRLQFDLNG